METAINEMAGPLNAVFFTGPLSFVSLSYQKDEHIDYDYSLKFDLKMRNSRYWAEDKRHLNRPQSLYHFFCKDYKIITSLYTT